MCANVLAKSWLDLSRSKYELSAKSIYDQVEIVLIVHTTPKNKEKVALVCKKTRNIKKTKENSLCYQNLPHSHLSFSKRSVCVVVNILHQLFY